MTEQDKDFGGHFIFESLGKKDRPGLYDDFHQKLLAELNSGTTQIVVKVEEVEKDVLFGKPSRVEQRKRPGYARKVGNE